MIVFRDSADVAKVVKLPILRASLRVLLHCCHHARARGVRRRFRAQRQGSNGSCRRIGCARSTGEFHEHVGYFCARRRADRRCGAAVAPPAGLRACGGLGQRAGYTGGEAARRHPDAQDAVGAGLERRATSPPLQPGSRSTLLPQTSTTRAGSTCCPMATCSSPNPTQIAGPPRSVFHYAMQATMRRAASARRQRQPYHAVAGSRR